MSTFARRLALWRLLESHPAQMGLRDLAERFEVSKQTTQRDLDALSTAGIPIVEQRMGQAALFSVSRPQRRVAPIEPTHGAGRPQDDPDRGRRLGRQGLIHPVIASKLGDERVVQPIEAQFHEDD